MQPVHSNYNKSYTGVQCRGFSASARRPGGLAFRPTPSVSWRARGRSRPYGPMAGIGASAKRRSPGFRRAATVEGRPPRTEIRVPANSRVAAPCSPTTTTSSTKTCRAEIGTQLSWPATGLRRHPVHSGPAAGPNRGPRDPLRASAAAVVVRPGRDGTALTPEHPDNGPGGHSLGYSGGMVQAGHRRSREVRHH